jgi:hypothetical protein
LIFVEIFFNEASYADLVTGWLLVHILLYTLFVGFIYFLGRNEKIGSLPALSRF